MEETLLVKDHPLSLQVLQLTESVLHHNPRCLGDASLKTIIHTVSSRTCRGYDLHTLLCLEVLDTVLKYSDIPHDELMAVLTAFCVLMCDEKIREQAWSLVRALLTSHMGHRTRTALITILNDSGAERREQPNPNDECNEKNMKMVLRGAIFCLGNANWGAGQVDAVRSSLGKMIEPLRNVVRIDEIICAGKCSNKLTSFV
ncbi:hypothetical protein COOONC_00224 [Cooperia oncophora]